MSRRMQISIIGILLCVIAVALYLNQRKSKNFQSDQQRRSELLKSQQREIETWRLQHGNLTQNNPLAHHPGEVPRIKAKSIPAAITMDYYFPTYRRRLDRNGNPIKLANDWRQLTALRYADLLIPRPLKLPYRTNPLSAYYDYLTTKQPEISIMYSMFSTLIWPKGSEIYWYSSLTGRSQKGSIAQADNRQFEVSYTNPPVSSSMQDHIYLKILNRKTGAEASANFYVRFHSKYEDFRVTSVEKHPHPFSYNLNRPGRDWPYYVPLCMNGTDSKQEYQMPRSTNAPNTPFLISTVQTWGAIGGNRYLGDAGKEALFKNEGIKTGKLIRCMAQPNFRDKYALKPNTALCIIGAPIREHIRGVCSVWGIYGYIGETTWEGIRCNGKSIIKVVFVKMLPSNKSMIQSKRPSNLKLRLPPRHKANKFGRLGN